MQIPAFSYRQGGCSPLLHAPLDCSIRSVEMDIHATLYAQIAILHCNRALLHNIGQSLPQSYESIRNYSMSDC